MPEKLTAETAVNAAHPGLAWEIRLSPSQSIMPAGRNGPYLDLESPARNTAHWLVTFSVAYSLSGDARFRETGERLANFLVENTLYKVNGAWVNRQKPPKDWCNGVIGQAWIVEGLHRAARYLQLDTAATAAQQLVLQLPFSDRYGAWERMDPVSGRMSVDFTYNHQSWFAAARAEVLGGNDAEVQKFLNMSYHRSFGVDNSGIIRHSMGNKPSKRTPAVIAAALRKRWDLGARRAFGGIAVDPVERGVGYHLYVLHSLARLYNATNGNHTFFESDSFRTALRTAASPLFVQQLEDNHYAYPYNAPGFEYPLIVETFSHLEPGLTFELAQEALAVQRHKTYCQDTGLYTLGTDDPVTLAARAYELMIAAE